MPAQHGRARFVGIAAAALLAGVVVAGCGFSKSKPTPIIVYVTPSPTPVVSASPATTPTPSASSVDTSTASPTAAPTPTPPPPASAVPATICSVDPKKPAEGWGFWTDAANGLPFAVYCGVVPPGWYYYASELHISDGSWVTATYKGPNGSTQPTIVISEGAFCGESCSPGSYSAPANFGDLPGKLYTTSGGGYAIYVDPGTAHAYTATGVNVDQTTFVNFVAALAKIARSS
jgi:hypothetical protein